MDPKGKVALITGGARIGKSVAEALARRGCDVVLTFRSSLEAAEDAAETVRRAGARAVTVQADLSVDGSAAAVIDETDRRFGRLDILINMASVYRKVPFEKLDLAAWQSSLAVDLQGSYLVSLKAVPMMLRHGTGRIINFSDWVAASGRPRYKQFTPYYVWKR
ncbi:MAG TPA: SDR family NAD(P)-dependent oxidoreductase, partial [Nitrospiria bacterium]|nr:SDR family NAD(P)-dependent oxidoreductase [Nitrospiria bacterium]